MTDIPVSAEYASLTQETVGELTQKVSTEINPSAETPRSEEDHTNGLIADLAWILLLGAIVTLLFKKMNRVLFQITRKNIKEYKCPYFIPKKSKPGS